MVVVDSPLPKSIVSNVNEIYSSEIDDCRPFTPQSADCLSSTAESDHEASFSIPCTRDPSLLRERLEKSKMKAQGKRKNRRDNFEREIANRGGNIKIDSKHIEFHSNKSSFTELLNSTSKMRAWEAFTSLSEEDQRNFLKSKAPRMPRRNLDKIEEEMSDMYIDARVIHPASVEVCRCSKLPSVTTAVSRKEDKTRDTGDKREEELEDCFEINKPLEKDCFWNVEIVSNAYAVAELLQGHRKLFIIGSQFSVSKQFQNLEIQTETIRRFGFDGLICFIELGSDSSVTGCILFSVENNAVRDCITSALYRTILRYRLSIPQCLVSENNKKTYQAFTNRDDLLSSSEGKEYAFPEESDSSSFNSSFEVVSESEL